LNAWLVGSPATKGCVNWRSFSEANHEETYG
jgi:hypothetical protein